MSKYSENLAKFRKSARNKIYSRVLLLNRDDTGNPVTHWEMQHIIIGFAHDGDVCGAYLNRILCGNPQTWCFCGLAAHVTDITEAFWPLYERDGRCVIDRSHTGWFANDADRFTLVGTTRHCNWCGQWHDRSVSKQTKTVRREVWARQESIAQVPA